MPCARVHVPSQPHACGTHPADPFEWPTTPKTRQSRPRRGSMSASGWSRQLTMDLGTAASCSAVLGVYWMVTSVLPIIQHHGCSERGVCHQGAGCATPVTPVRDSGLKRSGALSLRESQTIVQAAASADRAPGRCFKLTEPSGSNTNSYSLLQGPHSQKCSSRASLPLP